MKHLFYWKLIFLLNFVHADLWAQTKILDFDSIDLSSSTKQSVLADEVFTLTNVDYRKVEKEKYQSWIVTAFL